VPSYPSASTRYISPQWWHQSIAWQLSKCYKQQMDKHLKFLQPKSPETGKINGNLGSFDTASTDGSGYFAVAELGTPNDRSSLVGSPMREHHFVDVANGSSLDSKARRAMARYAKSGSASTPVDGDTDSGASNTRTVRQRMGRFRIALSQSLQPAQSPGEGFHGESPFIQSVSAQMDSFGVLPIATSREVTELMQYCAYSRQ
jgi:hypothetical protein